MASLDQLGFAELAETRQMVEVWQIDDHTERPHRSLNQQMPAAWAVDWAPAQKVPG
jgi:hypothetical protein